MPFLERCLVHLIAQLLVLFLHFGPDLCLECSLTRFSLWLVLNWHPHCLTSIFGLNYHLRVSLQIFRFNFSVFALFANWSWIYFLVLRHCFLHLWTPHWSYCWLWLLYFSQHLGDFYYSKSWINLKRHFLNLLSYHVK